MGTTRGLALAAGLTLLLLLRSPCSSSSPSSSSSSSAGTSIESVLPALQCPPCEQIHCVPRRPDRLKCRGGVTLGVCLCCPVCAKVEGDTCGGQWNYLGKCDRGLVCQAPQQQHDSSASYAYSLKSGEVGGGVGVGVGGGPGGEMMSSAASVYQPNKKGVCQKIVVVVPVTRELFNSDQGHASYCQPKCNPDFCLKNPKAICAAIDNAERKRDCQNPCQHTSCSACRFVAPEPDCVKCATDDFQCFRRYSKCVRKQFCHKQKFPCKRMNEVEPGGGKFMCMVAECLDSNHASSSRGGGGGGGKVGSSPAALLPTNLI